MSSDSICVAVRVRPFNSREVARKSKLCMNVDINRQSVEIVPPPEYKKRIKKFTFDFVYWSHDSSKKEKCKVQRKEKAEQNNYECTNIEDDRHSNMDVYNDLGKKILENAWQGYNASIFAYGQTGSGKSYSMVGYGEDLGIIPLICNELFERVTKETTEKLKFKVTVSMLEIYNEQVQDLFTVKKNRPQGGLKVREHPKVGPYVDGLKVFPVNTYKEISDLMDKGSCNRTVASTNMNQTSSRAHTLFTITLTITEIDKEKQKAVDKVSRITLVDLAGSERANSTGATGDRLKEGCAINQSLSALGNVISQLVKKCNAKTARAKKKIFIPYRTSILTWLLRESLGGNSRTIMVAALSPASINYEETLSTLQYANRAKQIKNKAVVNEDPNVTMIKSLKKELDDLKKKLAMQDTQHLQKLQEELKASQMLIQKLQMTDEDAEEQKKRFNSDISEELQNFGVTFDNEQPAISNLHPDSLMNNKIIYTLNRPATRVGKKIKSNDVEIKLGGVSMKKIHCKFVNEEGKLFIEIGESESKTYINGKLLENKIELHHFDRIIFGSHHTFRVNMPKEKEEMGENKHRELEDEIDFVYCQEEYAKEQGLSSMMDEDEQEKLVQQKIKEEMEKINQKKREEEKKLEEQKKLLIEKQKQMEERFKDPQLQKQKQLFEEQRKKQKEEIERQKLLLEKKRMKLLEDMKKQEELQMKIKEKEARDRKRKRLLEKKLLELIPMVTESNEYSKELGKPMEFGIKLINFVEEDEDGKPSYKTDIVIETDNKGTQKKSIWNFEKFESRFYQMQPLYNKYMYHKENNENYKLELKPEEDPFWDPVEEKSILIGISMIYLKSLSHLIEMDLWTPIIQGNGEVIGELKCGIIPTNEKGVILKNSYAPLAENLIGKPLHFKVVIESARGIPSELSLDNHVQYKVGFINDTPEKTETEQKKTRHPTFKYEKFFSIKTVTKEIVEYLKNSAIKFEFFGKKTDDIKIIEAKDQQNASDKMLRAVQKLMKIYRTRSTSISQDNKNQQAPKVPRMIRVLGRLSALKQKQMLEKKEKK